jgi:hypothetical protein
MEVCGNCGGGEIYPYSRGVIVCPICDGTGTKDIPSPPPDPLLVEADNDGMMHTGWPDRPA